MATELKGMCLGGRDKVVEVDGGYFGGYVKPANRKEMRRDRRLAKNQNGKRQVVVVMRERDGRTLPAVFRSESAALRFIASRALPGTSLMADEAEEFLGAVRVDAGLSRIQAAMIDPGDCEAAMEVIPGRRRRRPYECQATNGLNQSASVVSAGNILD
jgi:hypothetical protein